MYQSRTRIKGQEWDFFAYSYCSQRMYILDGFRLKSLLIWTHWVYHLYKHVSFKVHGFNLYITHTKIKNNLLILKCFRYYLNFLFISVFYCIKKFLKIKTHQYQWIIVVEKSLYWGFFLQWQKGKFQYHPCREVIVV